MLGETRLPSCKASILSSPASLRFVGITSISIEDPGHDEGRTPYEVVISHERGAEERLRGSIKSGTNMTIDQTTYDLLLCFFSEMRLQVFRSYVRIESEATKVKVYRGASQSTVESLRIGQDHGSTHRVDVTFETGKCPQWAVP